MAPKRSQKRPAAVKSNAKKNEKKKKAKKNMDEEKKPNAPEPEPWISTVTYDPEIPILSIPRSQLNSRLQTQDGTDFATEYWLGKRAFELWSATAGLDSEEELPDAAEDLEPTFGKL